MDPMWSLKEPPSAVLPKVCEKVKPLLAAGGAPGGGTPGGPSGGPAGEPAGGAAAIGAVDGGGAAGACHPPLFQDVRPVGN